MAWDDSGMGRRALALGISALGLGVRAFSLHVARDEPGYWFAGDSTIAAVALLAAGWALIGCGLVSCCDGREAASGRCSPQPASPGSCPSGTTRRRRPAYPHE
jgi:hypothetical protein